jgi:transposase
MPNCERCGAERQRLHKHHVKPRHLGGTFADGKELLCANCHEDEHLELTPNQAARAAARRAARPPEAQLREWYVDEGLSLRQIAAKLDTATSNVQLWVADYGIERRVGHGQIQAPSGVDLAALYAKHTSIEIGEMFGVTPLVARRWLIEAGVEIRARGARSDAEQVDVAATATALTMSDSVAEAAQRLGVPATTLHARARRLGLAVPTKTVPSKREVEKAYIATGFKIPELASHFGVSYSTANRWLTEYGIERRGKPGRPRKEPVA